MTSLEGLYQFLVKLEDIEYLAQAEIKDSYLQYLCLTLGTSIYTTPKQWYLCIRRCPNDFRIWNHPLAPRFLEENPELLDNYYHVSSIAPETIEKSPFLRYCLEYINQRQTMLKEQKQAAMAAKLQEFKQECREVGIQEGGYIQVADEERYLQVDKLDINVLLQTHVVCKGRYLKLENIKGVSTPKPLNDYSSFLSQISLNKNNLPFIAKTKELEEALLAMEVLPEYPLYYIKGVGMVVCMTYKERVDSMPTWERLGSFQRYMLD